MTVKRIIEAGVLKKKKVGGGEKISTGKKLSGRIPGTRYVRAAGEKGSQKKDSGRSVTDGGRWKLNILKEAKKGIVRENQFKWFRGGLW